MRKKRELQINDNELCKVPVFSSSLLLIRGPCCVLRSLSSRFRSANVSSTLSVSRSFWLLIFVIFLIYCIWGLNSLSWLNWAEIGEAMDLEMGYVAEFSWVSRKGPREATRPLNALLLVLASPASTRRRLPFWSSEIGVWSIHYIHFFNRLIKVLSYTYRGCSCCVMQIDLWECEFICGWV